jgi:hypothetical protein
MSMRREKNIVPGSMWYIYESIGARTDVFSQQFLNEDYGRLARRMTAALARKHATPLRSGTFEAWACGILYALGKLNGLFDPARAPHIRARDLCEWFGVTPASGAAKARLIIARLAIGPNDVKWHVGQAVRDVVGN